MRSSVLSRSVIAVATLAIGSVALAAVPATAATPAGITRDAVLSAAKAVRAEGASLSSSTSATLVAFAAATCNFPQGSVIDPDIDAVALPAGDDADGLLIAAATTVNGDYSGCAFGLLATTDGTTSLTGTGTITARLTDTPAPGSGQVKSFPTALSGNVAATAPLFDSNDLLAFDMTLTASGNATKTTVVEGTRYVADKKSKAEKKAAKKSYDKRLKAAKKSYTKALKKAGSSKSKKTAAKKSYAAKRAAAKAKYRAAIADFKVVRVSTPVTENRPFNGTTAVLFPLV